MAITKPVGLTVKNNLTSMSVGDYIWCKYVASSGALGVFSGIGSVGGSFADPSSDISPITIPVSTTASNGWFTFICVDRKVGKGGLLVADRNIQGSLSWTLINLAGYMDGKVVSKATLGIPVADTNINNVLIRSLTGGVGYDCGYGGASAVPGDFNPVGWYPSSNEWDTFIDNNAAVGSGADNVWHNLNSSYGGATYGLYSYVKDVNTKGDATTSGFYVSARSNKNSTGVKTGKNDLWSEYINPNYFGFRPALEFRENGSTF